MSERRTARRIRPSRIATLAEYDPALGALDAALISSGWKCSKSAIIRRRKDGRITGRVVWRRAGESIVWSATFAYQGSCG